MIQGSGIFRIVTWNCSGGKFDWRAGEVSSLNPDVAIIQEIAAPKTQDHNCCWAPTVVPFKGVAIITRNGFSVEPFPQDPDVPDLFFPVIIHGPVDFHLLGVWTQEVGRYIESCKPAFERYRDFLLSKPSVIAGDFNSNSRNDSFHTKLNHTMTVELMEKEYGLVSSYHKKLQVDHGNEPHMTYYSRPKKPLSFHYDYCFVPGSWNIKNVEIGSKEEWAERSDHLPLIVDIEL